MDNSYVLLFICLFKKFVHASSSLAAIHFNCIDDGGEPAKL